MSFDDIWAATYQPTDLQTGDDMIEVYQDGAGEWRFRIKGANGEIVATGEGYSDKSGACEGVRALARIMIGAVEFTSSDMGVRITTL